MADRASRYPLGYGTHGWSGSVVILYWPYDFLMKRASKTFKEKVFDVVRKIPKGKVLTYKQVAEKIGAPRAARAVGSALKTNYDKSIPCHRVIRSDGKMGGYNRGGISVKKKILVKEGYDF